MKKSLTAALMVCCAACGAKDCTEGKSAYEGAYVGAGLSYQNNMYDVEVSDNLGDVAVKCAIETVEKAGGQLDKESAVAYAESLGLVNLQNHGLNRKNNGKIGGSLNAGYGKFVYSNFYLGADFSLDISERGKSVNIDKFYRDDKIYGRTTVQTDAIVPTLTLKIGGYIPDVDTLICIRAGAARIGMKVENELLQNKVRLNKITPVVGLGIEKRIFKNYSVKLEGDYRFPISKQISGETNNLLDINNQPISVSFNEKVKTRGYCIRLMSIYHF